MARQSICSSGRLVLEHLMVSNWQTGLPKWVDAVEKSLAIIGVAIGGRFRPIPGRALPPDRRTPELTCQASYAIDAHTPSIGGPGRRSGIVLRFCTMAARGNSWGAPVG